MSKPLVLWGGVDIDTRLYGERRSNWTQSPDLQRDAKEISFIKSAMLTHTPVIGVCRGAQLLCVMNGGKLYQHSKPTMQDHGIKTTDGYYFDNVAASHHQIMRPEGRYEILAVNPHPVDVWDSEHEYWIVKENTPEVVWYPDWQHLCIQPHPEWGKKGDKFVEWVNNIISEFDIDFKF